MSVKRYSCGICAEVLEKACVHYGQETVKFQSIYTVRIDLELPAHSRYNRAFNRPKIERLITQFSLSYYVSSVIFVDEENSCCRSFAVTKFLYDRLAKTLWRNILTKSND